MILEVLFCGDGWIKVYRVGVLINVIGGYLEDGDSFFGGFMVNKWDGWNMGGVLCCEI